MGTKHDILTEQELSSYSINPIVKHELTLYYESQSLIKNKVRILDWGCGRGRSVYKLKEEGYDAIGYDIDPMVIKNGQPLAESRGYNVDIIQTIDHLTELESDSIDFIFSEQVFEDVADLGAVAEERYRVMRKGGLSVNCYPGTLTILEEHLLMPFIHWLPKNMIRIPYMYFLVILGKEPKKRWPELTKTSAWQRTLHFYQYLEKHTFYRRIDEVYKVFTNTGFKVSHAVKSTQRRWIPKLWRKNGFPQASFTLRLEKV